ncbi:hypothetical protein BJP34_31365 [Moorena producens PAL-8-15-08-1]|uniref:Uncharacterized protein n=1 Tax=Moorena producens PAL-8-15-08-1 TaxID=1458985 RepID=A0A1D8U0A7_9CYAN|nr:hypothetical protein BJP34_31365 [Moorena producens PAL-8-15-08-1]
MKLPISAKPINRDSLFVGSSNQKNGIKASQLGTCFDNQGINMGTNNFNQVACCARRDTKNGGFWLPQGGGIPVNC